MSAENIFFSIVVPTYNRESLLVETIESILNQSFKAFELLIIDDGSTDNTQSKITAEYKHEPRLRYFKKKNEERGRARNFGHENATGEYVIFFDSDDLMMSDHLSILHQKILALAKPNFIATKHLLISEDKKIFYNQSKNLKSGWYNYSDLINGNWLASHFAVKKDNPDYIPFVEDRKYAILEDWIFLVENLYKDKIYLIDEFTIHQKIHKGRSMNNNLLIIERKILATKYLTSKLPLTNKEKKKLTGAAYKLCAIHAYIEGDKTQSYQHCKTAIANGYFGKDIIILLMKLLFNYSPAKSRT